MKRPRPHFLLLLGALLLRPGPALDAQPFSLELEAGYRFVEVDGNEQMYRSQINDRQGILVRSVSFLGGSPGAGFFDEIRLDATDLGAGPAGSLRLEAGRRGTYRLRLAYSRREHYSALPGFANPLLAEGILPGQHTMNRTRHLLDVELELLPGAAVTPILGYTRNALEGPGRTTYGVGGDEFLLDSDVDDTDQEYRVGVAFEAGAFAGRVVQGWRQFDSTETFSLAPGAGPGNNVPPLLDVPVALDGFTRSTRTDADTPATSAFLSGRLGERVRVVGAFASARAEGDTSEREDLSGQLVSFQISRFFGGLAETASTRSKLKQWHGTGRVEVNVAEGIDFSASYQRRKRELDGFALIETLFLDTVTFAGQDPRDLLQLLEARTALERTEDIYGADLAARSLGPLALRAGWSQTDQDVEVTPDPAEIVVPGGQGGRFERTIRAWNAGAILSVSAFTLGADYRSERADDAVVRTDFLDRDRYRLRAGWSLGDKLRVGATAERIDSENDRPEIGFDGRVRQYGGDLDVSFWKPLRVRFAAGKYEADSELLIRRPEDFTTEGSIHAEDGKYFEGGLTVSVSRLALEGAYGRFENEGSFPFDIDRSRVRADFTVNANVGLIAEWNRDDYSEEVAGIANLGDYRANRYGLYVRWRQ
jgi:hypothetical protein